VLDATRIHDGAKVVLKHVLAKGDEIHIALHLPILDVLTTHGRTKEVFLAIPYLRQSRSPPFHYRAESVEALRQYVQVSRPGSMIAKYTYLHSFVGP
jgi:hypothetical protein